jgi:acyl carrier protein
MNARTDLQSESQSALEAEVANLIVQALNLEIAAPAIDPNTPLFREGLELDSIDMLEIALEVSKRYGFQMRSDDTDNARIFASLRALSAHIESNRTK